MKASSIGEKPDNAGDEKVSIACITMYNDHLSPSHVRYFVIFFPIFNIGYSVLKLS